MEKTRGDIFITIRSRDLINMASGDNNNYGRFNLFSNILAEEDEILAVQLASATIPNSFYNLSNNNENNTITFKEGAGAYATLTIPSGSYNINELSDEIKALMDAQSATWGNNITYSFSYDEINNQLTITSTTPLTNTTFDFTTATSCRRFLGFTESTPVISTASGITSDRGVDITDTKNSLYVRLPNLSNNKVIESSTGKFSNIVAQIPVELSRNLFFTYDPPVPFILELSQKQINSIDILITYQEETNNVNFERCDWEINLMISFFYNPDRKHQNLRDPSLDAVLQRRIDDFNEKTNLQAAKTAQLEDFINSNDLKVNG